MNVSDRVSSGGVEMRVAENEPAGYALPMTYRPFVLVAALSSSPAWAVSAPDLAVSLTPPAGAHVYQTAGYNVRVRNVGNRNAAGVALVIQLPRTATSPTVYVMGTLGSHSSSCSVVNTSLVCALGTINRNGSDSVFFDIALPYSTAPLVIAASATTTTPGDPNPLNNTLTYTATPLTYSVTMNTVDQAVNRHCTGQPSLSSFFECTLFPSSISSHDTIFNADNTISFVDAPATYTGTWTYTAGANRLQFQYLDGPSVVAIFDGRGVSATCFEGKTTFPANTSYVSMYQVCFP